MKKRKSLHDNDIYDKFGILLNAMVEAHTDVYSYCGRNGELLFRLISRNQSGRVYHNGHPIPRIEYYRNHRLIAAHNFPQEGRKYIDERLALDAINWMWENGLID